MALSPLDRASPLLLEVAKQQQSDLGRPLSLVERLGGERSISVSPSAALSASRRGISSTPQTEEPQLATGQRRLDCRDAADADASEPRDFGSAHGGQRLDVPHAVQDESAAGE